MSEQMIACCGLDCVACEGYRATQAGDLAGLERVAEQWRKEYGAPATVEYVTCDGCRSTSGRLSGHCPQCDIRACAYEHGVANCAQCSEFGCVRITRFMGIVPQAAQCLRSLRAEA